MHSTGGLTLKSPKGRILVESSLVVVLGVAVLGALMALKQGNEYKFLDPIIETEHIIATQFVDEPDLKKLQEGAIKGMVEALNDPYTVYVPAANSTEFTKDLTGEYVGIGAQINIVDGWLTIVSPLEDSPAYRVGLMAEDRVAEIEGESTHNMPVEDCMKRLMGEPGTNVKLTIERKGTKIPVTITRDRIKTKSVKGYHREDADGNKWMYLIDPKRKIGYLRLTQFTPKCAEEMASALISMGATEGELKGLVLDLRFNPGGILGEAISIADFFLNEGVIVSTRGRSHPEEIAKAHKEGTLPDFPLVVLLNGQSASASEVLAGALVENNRAIVVGTRSFGKGSVQTVRQLQRAKGAELKITEQGYYLPSGRSITRKDDSATWGVDPSEGFYVPITDEELTEMFTVRRRLEILRAADAKVTENAIPETKAADSKASEPMAAEVNWTDPESVLSALKDKQLTAAIRALQGRLDGGHWTPTGEKGITSGKIAAGELQKAQVLRDRLERELIKTDKRIDALEKGAGETVAAKGDLIPESADLKGGALKIFDKDGKLVTTLDITGNNLERWLIDADVKKRVDTATEAAPLKKE
jgi:carboxyl-terminal processing protease